MRSALYALGTAFVLQASAAVGCSFAGNEAFEPNLRQWEKWYDLEWEPIPAPEVSQLDVIRGTEPPGFSCNDAGQLSVHVRVPSGSRYTLDDFGVYFRVYDGDDAHGILPHVPLVGDVEGTEARFVFAWLDGAPDQQHPIDLILEMFFVSGDLSIGPSTFFRVQSE